MDSNILQFRSASRNRATAAPIGEASVIAFPSPERRVPSPRRARCSKAVPRRKSGARPKD